MKLTVRDTYDELYDSCRTPAVPVVLVQRVTPDSVKGEELVSVSSFFRVLMPIKAKFDLP